MSEIPQILQRTGECFGNIPGVKALVLGGSRATGTETEGSDLDIALYYDREIGLDAGELNRAAKALDDRHQDGLMTGIGGWGPWINGGGWLVVDGLPVDLLFRDFQRVSKVVEDCLKGQITLDYQPGHPFAFVNSIYLGEVACCKPFLEHDEELRLLKSRLHPYPETYRKAVYEKFLWEAEFSLLCGRKGVPKGDLTYCTGSLYRAVNCMVQVLYAVNGAYLLNEKGSIARLRSLGAGKHKALADRLDGLLAGLTLENLDSRFEEAKRVLELVRRQTEDKEGTAV